MRHLSKALLAVGVAALLAGPTFGQGFRPQNPLKFLLENQDAQKEMSLSEEQVKKAVTAADDVFKKHEDDFKGIEFGSAEGRQKMFEINKEITKETKKALADILDAKQMKRLNEITLQQSIAFQGPSAFMDADLQKSLKITDEQKDKIKTINEDLAKERDALRKDAGNDPDKRREVFQKMQGLNKEASDKVTKVITADQKKILDQLKGDPFELRLGPPR